MIDETALNIFTDGSSYSSPRTGGTGIRFVTVNDAGNEVIEDFPTSGYSGATNNQMELQACIDALKLAIKYESYKGFSKIIIFTDSSYVVENCSSARFQWSQNGWLRSNGSPVLNAPQWKDLIKTINKIHKNFWLKVEIKWIKGHAKSQHNKAVDKLAKQAAKTKSNKKISITKVRRKKFKESSVRNGSVEMLGQQISIYIVTDEFLKIQRIYRYKYQVTSPKSPFYKCTDTICSEEALNAGHYYSVRLNKNNQNPQIIKVFREIPLQART